MSDLRALPELLALSGGSQVVRVPPEVDVPLTDRVRRLIDTPQFRRLARISQLGLVQLVYPGATHSRFEHSLGVYRNALLFLDRLSSDERFCDAVGQADAELLLATALLHDIAHWPYCHPIEDLELSAVPEHEALAGDVLSGEPIATLLRNDWGIDSSDVAALLEGELDRPSGPVLASVLSGPIDVDKIDYLTRDSLHAGVPYGRNFDAPRLIQSLALNEAGDGIAITDKGKSAAEMLVFARYVMFSEVYWHRAVRSATAMLQRIVFQLADQLDWQKLFRSTDTDFAVALGAAAKGTPAEELFGCLFGSERRLYKCVAQYSLVESESTYRRLARRPADWLVGFAERIAGHLGKALGQPVEATDVLVDAPPVGLEVQFNIDVLFRADRRYRPLGEVSPMVRALAREQFDDYVKRVRVFLHPRLEADLLGTDLVQEAVEASSN